RVAGPQAVDVGPGPAEALDGDVGPGKEVLDVGAARCPSHRSFARVEVAEERRAVARVGRVARRGVRAERVAAGRLDLDHVDARVGEELRAVRPGDLGAEVDEAQMRERTVDLAARRDTRLAMLAHAFRSRRLRRRAARAPLA